MISTDKKIEVMKASNLLSDEVIKQLSVKFNERYEYAKTYYGTKNSRRA